MDPRPRGTRDECCRRQSSCGSISGEAEALGPEPATCAFIRRARSGAKGFSRARRSDESGAPRAACDPMTAFTSHGALDPPGWTIRPEQPIDIDQIHELHREAFAGPAEAALVDTIRAGATFLPELSLVAVTGDGSVLGHVLVSRIELETRGESARRVPVLALAPIGVLPPHQGRGIGSALMREAMDRADTLEEPCTVVLGSPPFYDRFGFEPAFQLGLTGPYDAAGDAFRVRPRPGADITPGRIVYPPAFSEI